MSQMKYQEWVELTITLSPEDIKSLQVSAHIGGDSSGIIEHIVQLAKDVQILVKGKAI